MATQSQLTQSSTVVVDQFHNALAAKHAKGLNFRVTDFLFQLVPLAQMAIDTPEERQAIAKAVMAFYDTKINGSVPEAFRVKTREFVSDCVNTSLQAAAVFAPPKADAAADATATDATPATN